MSFTSNHHGVLMFLLPPILNFRLTEPTGGHSAYGIVALKNYAVLSPTNSAVVTGYNVSESVVTHSNPHGQGSYNGACKTALMGVLAPKDATRVMGWFGIDGTDVKLSEQFVNSSGHYCNGACTVDDIYCVFAPNDAPTMLMWQIYADSGGGGSMNQLTHIDLTPYNYVPFSFTGIDACNGWAVCAPAFARKILCYHPSTSSVKEIDFNIAGTTGQVLFNSAVTIGDWVVFAPYNSPVVMCVNPVTEQVQYSAPHGLGTECFRDSVSIHDEWAVFAPENSDKFLAYNPVTNDLKLSTTHGLPNDAMGGITSNNEWAICAPRSSPKVVGWNLYTDTIIQSDAVGLVSGDAFAGACSIRDLAIFGNDQQPEIGIADL